MIHGQKKTKKVKTQQEIQQEQAKSQKINTKLQQFFQLRKKQIALESIPALLDFTSILMQLCSDIPTIFNFRRQILEKVYSNPNQSLEKKIATFVADYKLNTKIIQSDPKSYTLWTHRQWLVKKIYQSDKSIINTERDLCKKLLQRDEKNFHVWNYRSWVNGIDMVIDEQLAFTKQKIKENPFNFSPYHFRSKYLLAKYCSMIQGENKQQILLYGMPKQIMDQQIEDIQTAIFLNPQQQAPWTYYNWLIQLTIPCLLVSCKQKSQGIIQLLFSRKITNPSKLAKSQTPQMFNQENAHMSQTWLVKTNIQNLEIKSNLQNCEQMQIEGISRVVIGSQKNEKISNELKSFLRNRLQFVKQVIESQENKCRFGWLQAIFIARCIIQNGCKQQQWNQLGNYGLECFENLKQETKNSKYVQKQFESWKSLLSADAKQTQKLLRTYY